jgi:hypothetical protein
MGLLFSEPPEHIIPSGNKFTINLFKKQAPPVGVARVIPTGSSHRWGCVYDNISNGQNNRINHYLIIYLMVEIMLI